MRLRDKALSRLMLIIVAIFVATSALMTALAYRVAAQYALSQIEAVIASDLGGLVESWQQNGIKGVETALARRMAAPDPRALYLLVSEDGTKIAGDFDFWPNNLSQEQKWTRFERGRERYDGMSTRLLDGARVLIAHRRAEHEAMLAGLRADLIAPALVGLLAAVLVSFFILRRLFDRIERINATSRAVTGGALDARVPLDAAPDEFHELGANVNAMLDRIDVLMAGTRHLSDSIAHEMRTPLSHLRARLEREARQIELSPDSPLKTQALAALESGITEANGVIALFTALLDIAAIEADEGDPAGLVALDMAQIAREAVSLYEALAEERSIALTLEAAPAPILGIEHLLMRVLANLIDNALKFSEPGQSVALRCGQEGAESFFDIRDEGPGMPDAFLARASERFSRAPNAKGKPGHGLGLSLVQAVCRRHGIVLRLENAAPGLRVSLRWPTPKR